MHLSSCKSPENVLFVCEEIWESIQHTHRVRGGVVRVQSCPFHTLRVCCQLRKMLHTLGPWRDMMSLPLSFWPPMKNRKLLKVCASKRSSCIISQDPVWSALAFTVTHVCYVCVCVLCVCVTLQGWVAFGSEFERHNIIISTVTIIQILT